VPTHVAYILKTAALNRDKRLLQYGIHAVRLDGEENYIEVETGEIGPLLLPKRRPPYLKWFFWSIIGLAILAGGLIVAMAGSLPVLNSATSTATLTITASPTNTQTPSATSTPTSTTTQTTTPTPTGTATQTTTPTPTYTPSPISVIPGHSQNNPQSAPGVLAPPDLKKPLEVIAVPVYPSIPKDPTEPPVCKLVTEVVCDPQTNECKKVEYCK
jgi:hypothetical protein